MGAEASEKAGAQAASRPAHQRNYSPPYRLMGNKLIFTNWSFISSGSFGWYDAAGRQWKTSEDKPFGELHLVPSQQATGIRIVAEQAKLGEPFLLPRGAWEAHGVNLTTVIHDAGIYRGWGIAYKDVKTPTFCYYESSDGSNWQRPDLGLVEFEGSRKNNIVLAERGNHTVFLDPAAPQAERFKMVVGDRADGIYGLLSPDGIHWTRIPEPICRDTNDTVNIAYFDEAVGKYVLYNRKFYHDRRAIGRTESADFRHFPTPELNLEPGPNLAPTDQLYTNGRTAIPGSPENHLLFPMIYQLNNDLARTGLLSSYDGLNWHWLSTESVLPRPTGQWEHGWMLANPNLVELPDGSLAISYTVVNMPHKYPRARFQTATGWAIWPKGRFIAVQAPGDGAFTTQAIVPRGHKLRINAVTEPGGAIRVQASAPGRGFDDCQPLAGDLYQAPVRWREHDDLGNEPGGEVTLSFRLSRARIYGLEFSAG